MRSTLISVLLASFGLAGCGQPPPPPVIPTSPAPVAPAPQAAPAQPATIQVVAPDAPPPGPADLRSIPALPRPSPNAELRQTVGVTHLHLSYSSPGVKGRQVWGELVPYGKVWRTGANAPTTLVADHDFTFGGTAVPAGRYTLLTVPGEKTWTVHLNKDPKGAGAFGYDAEQDVAKVEVEPTSASPRERLAFTFDDTTEKATQLVLHWAELKVAVPIEVDTAAHAKAAIAATVDNAWRPLFNAGRYAFDQENHDQAADLLSRSIQVKGTWWNHWWLAQTHHAKGEHDKARQHAQKTTELGKGDDTFEQFFAERVKKALTTWPQT